MILYIGALVRKKLIYNCEMCMINYERSMTIDIKPFNIFLALTFVFLGDFGHSIFELNKFIGDK